MHTSAYANRPIDYIVIHYTAGTSSKKGVARNIAAMFANPANRAASADFIVDDEEIVQFNSDLKGRYTYAVGGSKYPSQCNKESGKYYQRCRNYNSLSIELCSSKINKKTLNATDTDWYFTEAVLKNGAELTKYLMKAFNVPIDRVICHFHVTSKPCPAIFAYGDAGLAKWYAFKKRLTGNSSITDSTSVVEKIVNYNVVVTDPTGLNCRSGIGTGFNIVTTYPVGTVLSITKEAYSWGFTGKGWVNMSYTQKVETSTVKEDEINMTKEEFLKSLTAEECLELYNKAMSILANKEESDWSQKEGHWQRATNKGVVDGSAPQKPTTREQLATILGRLGVV